MENKTIEQLLDSLTALVGDARGSLFGQDKCMVDRDQLLYLVDQLQNQIPEEIKQSKAIIESCNALRTNAKKDAAETRRAADNVLTDAEERAARLIEETTIVEIAKIREKEIVDETEQKRSDLISGAMEYADRIMEEAEQSVISTYEALYSGIEILKKRAKDDEKDALDRIAEARAALKNAAAHEQTQG